MEGVSERGVGGGGLGSGRGGGVVGRGGQAWVKMGGGLQRVSERRVAIGRKKSCETMEER